LDVDPGIGVSAIVEYNRTSAAERSEIRREAGHPPPVQDAPPCPDPAHPVFYSKSSVFFPPPSNHPMKNPQVIPGEPFYASALYYSVAWVFCLLHLTGAAAGFFLLRGARWGRTLIVCISILIVLATIVMLSGGITLPAAYSVVSVLAAVSLVSMYVSAIVRLAGIRRRDDA
jgi:hypothetical protein